MSQKCNSKGLGLSRSGGGGKRGVSHIVWWLLEIHHHGNKFRQRILSTFWEGSRSWDWLGRKMAFRSANQIYIARCGWLIYIAKCGKSPFLLLGPVMAGDFQPRAGATSTWSSVSFTLGFLGWPGRNFFLVCECSFSLPFLFRCN